MRTSSRGDGATKCARRRATFDSVRVCGGGAGEPESEQKRIIFVVFFFRTQVPRTVWRQLTCFSTNFRAPSRTGESAGQTTPQFLQLKRNIPRAPPRPNLRIKILAIIFFFSIALL